MRHISLGKQFHVSLSLLFMVLNEYFHILRENLLGDSKIIRLILRSYLRHSKTRETWIPLKYLFNWIFNPLILLHQEDMIKKKIEHIVGWIDWINSVLYSFCSAMSAYYLCMEANKTATQVPALSISSSIWIFN